MEELHHPMKQTKLHASKYNSILGKEPRVGGRLLKQGPLLGLTLYLIKFQVCWTAGYFFLVLYLVLKIISEEHISFNQTL